MTRRPIGRKSHRDMIYISGATIINPAFVVRFTAEARTWREAAPDSFTHTAVADALARIGSAEVAVIGNMLMSYADELRDADKDY